jgi:hypothetical protein
VIVTVAVSSCSGYGKHKFLAKTALILSMTVVPALTPYTMQSMSIMFPTVASITISLVITFTGKAGGYPSGAPYGTTI